MTRQGQTICERISFPEQGNKATRDLPAALKELLHITSGLWTFVAEDGTTGGPQAPICLAGTEGPDTAKKANTANGSISRDCLMSMRSSGGKKGSITASTGRAGADPEGRPGCLSSVPIESINPGLMTTRSPRGKKNSVTASAGRARNDSEARLSSLPTENINSGSNYYQSSHQDGDSWRSALQTSSMPGLQDNDNLSFDKILRDRFKAAVKQAPPRQGEKDAKRKIQNLPIQAPMQHGTNQAYPYVKEGFEAPPQKDANNFPGPPKQEKSSLKITPCEMTHVESDEEEDDMEPDLELDDVEVIVGPTHFAFWDRNVEDAWIPGGGEAFPVLSRPNKLVFTDLQRLSRLREQTPLSFGSLLHACGQESNCRPCMFERAPGRCRKVWLCDFCHLHTRRRRKPTP